MIEQLKKLFPSLLYYETMPKQLDHHYKWYITNDSHVIGIDRNELDNKNSELLSLFLIPLQHLFPLKTKEELRWEKHLQEEEINSNMSIQYRFVYFSILTNHIKPVEFKEAVNQLFEKETIILWENEQEGVLIETLQNKGEDTISYKEIIDILMSDLYGNMKFFIGPYREDFKNIRQHYDFIKKGARIVFSASDKNVVSYLEGIPIILMTQTENQIKKEIQSMVLQDFLSDREFIKMIEVFLDSNLNVSVAAKKLYMHRNSLQYRIEKFYEKTGIDIREFHQALTVYLAILTKND